MPQFQNFDELRSSKPGIWNSTNQDRVRHFKLLEKYKKMFLRELPDSDEDDVIDLTKIEYFCITSLVWQKAKRSENIERGFRVWPIVSSTASPTTTNKSVSASMKSSW